MSAPLSLELRTHVRYGIELFRIVAKRGDETLVASPEHLSPAGAKTWMHAWLERWAEEQRRAALH